MTNKHWKEEELAYFKKRLLSLRERLINNVNIMENEALRKSRQDSSGDLSNVPIHMADIGTDNFDRDMTIGLIENAEDGLRNIDMALEKIESNTYGQCELCGKLITKARLSAIPFAKYCIGCQRDEEK